MIRQLIREMLLNKSGYDTGSLVYQGANIAPSIYNPALATETKLRQLIRESILLTEAVSIEAAEATAKTKIESLVKGMIWGMEKSSQFHLTEKQLAWVKEYSPHIIAFAVVDDIIKILRGVTGNFDVDKDYQGDAFKWTYNQLFERIRKEQPHEIAKAFEFAIMRVVNDSKFSLEPIDISNLQAVAIGIQESWKYKSYMYWQKTLKAENYKTIIENYYQMLNFVQPEEVGKPAKRNIHLVADIAELEKLVDDARPRYQEFAGRRKKDSNVVQEGTHMLINNDRWWVATIHNASAAYEHAKCLGDENNLTDWCTATPGTGAKFFKKYYKEDDPLIIFKDKLNKTGYQFSFSSSQFMDASDQQINQRLKLELILLLSTVEDKIDERYTHIHSAIDQHPVIIIKKISKLPPKDRIVEGELNLEHAKITSLPAGLHVRGSLNLMSSDIISLPPGLKVEGTLNIQDTKIESLPLDLQVGWELKLQGTSIKSLPGGLKFGGSLRLRDTMITSIPSDLQIGGGLDLTGTGVTSLPDGFKVGTNLILRNSGITSLPSDLQVGGIIQGFSGDKSQVPQHLRGKLK